MTNNFDFFKYEMVSVAVSRHRLPKDWSWLLTQPSHQTLGKMIKHGCDKSIIIKTLNSLQMLPALPVSSLHEWFLQYDLYMLLTSVTADHVVPVPIWNLSPVTCCCDWLPGFVHLFYYMMNCSLVSLGEQKLYFLWGVNQHEGCCQRYTPFSY